MAVTALIIRVAACAPMAFTTDFGRVATAMLAARLVIITAMVVTTAF